MPSVTLSKVEAFAAEVGLASHNLSTMVLKCALTNTAPTAASTVWALGTFPAPAAANGYTAGGNTVTVTSWSQAAGVGKLVLADTVFTASAGGIGPFQYAILYNTSSGGTVNKIIGYYVYPTLVTLADLETFTIDFDAGLGALTIT